MLSSPLAAPPRHFISPPPPTPILPGPGLPQERHARIAARRAFVDLKSRFMSAVDALDGMRGDWLRYQVRQAHESRARSSASKYFLSSCVRNNLRSAMPCLAAR